MKYLRSSFLRFLLIIIYLISAQLSCDAPYSKDNHATPVRIGWQIPLSTQAQIVQVLMNTEILKKHKLQADFISFSYGGPQSEAALAGELDVIFIGDQPAINLIARGGKWKIVSRLFYTRTAIMVPLGSPIQKIADLRGKTVASPFGSVAHREATLKQKAAGLDPAKDVNNINVDILEISSLVQKGGETDWDKIDAVAVWEPSTSLFEINKLARILGYTPTLGVVAISEQFLGQQSDASVRLLEAILEAWAYFSAHTDKANQWYIKAANLPYTNEVLTKAASIEPNYKAKTMKEIDLYLYEQNIATLENGAQWAHESGYTKSLANIRPAVDLSFLQKAEQKKK